MLQMLIHAFQAVPMEIVIPAAIGVVIASLGLFLFPPTYHWDGKPSADYPR